MSWFKLSLGVGLLLAGCRNGENEAEAVGDVDGQGPAAVSGVNPRLQRLMPTGPSLAIEAGKGVGAIRLGATVATIERLMDRRCEVLSHNLCRYYTRGVDFHLVNGALAKVHVQRAGRPAGNDVTGKKLEFGFFNGGIRPDLALGMTPKAMQEYLGRPERIERVPEPNPQNMVARDYYPGLVIEYDRYKNGKIIFAGAVVFRDPRTDTLPELGMPVASPSSSGTAPPAPRRPVTIH